MTLINRRKPRPGVESGLEVSEPVETFGSPEEAVMWLEAMGHPRRVLALNFAPMYRKILDSGKVVPFPGTRTGKPGWREV